MSEVAIHRRPGREAAAALLESAGLPVPDLTDVYMEHFFYVGPASAPIGLIGVEMCGVDALLRSLVVNPEHRSAGLGQTLVAYAESHAREQGARAVYCLTTTAETFFRRRGYVDADRDRAPAAVRETREFSAICPASSAFLVKKLLADEPVAQEKNR
jgi:amino-acid N-acetyltransferase